MSEESTLKDPNPTKPKWYHLTQRFPEWTKPQVVVASLALSVSLLSMIMSAASLSVSWMNRQDVQLHDRTLEVHGAVGPSSSELVLTVPAGYNLGQCSLYFPPFLTDDHLPYKVRPPNTTLQLRTAFEHFASELKDKILEYRKQQTEKTGHLSVKIPVVASLSYSRYGVGHTAFQLYDLYCDIRWKPGESDLKIDMAISGFRCVEDVTSQIDTKERTSDEFVKARWAKRKDDFLKALSR